MNFAGLKKLEGKQVNLWPPVLVLPEFRITPMQWTVQRVDAKARIVEIHAPSGHFLNVVDVIHKYQQTGNYLILDVQLYVSGNAIKVEPRPWGQTTRTLNQAIADGLLRTTVRGRQQRRQRDLSLPLWSSETS